MSLARRALVSAIARALPCVLGALLAATAGNSQHTPLEKQLPCESLSASAAVFVGMAGAPVMRRVQLPEHPPLTMKLTPITVERAYAGVTTAVMYLTPLGIERYATPGRRYLVYGRNYHPPDIVMASPGYGAKPIESAGADLAFLDSLAPGATGGTISGVLQLKDLAFDRVVRGTTPLGLIPVRVANDRYSTEVVTGADGRFSVAVPAGTYDVVPDLPQDLATWDSTSRIQTTVADAGCAVLTIDTVFNGRVRGVLRGPDGSPLAGTSVDLMPIDVVPDATGHVKGTGSVGTNASGEFVFAGRPAGRYHLGVNLYNAPNPYGPSYPRTYYPGTTDPESAVAIVVERGAASDGFDFSIPTVLAKGQIEVTIDSDRPGRLRLCYVQLENRVRSWSTYDAKPATPQRFPVVEGQRYQVHAHLEFPGGHLESEPFAFTATTGQTSVRLRPDAPRALHR